MLIKAYMKVYTLVLLVQNACGMSCHKALTSVLQRTLTYP